MTREEAIKSLQNIIEYWTYKPTEVEAAKMAIAALRPVSREQVERLAQMDGCGDVGRMVDKLTRDKMLALRQSVVGPWAAHYVARAKRVD